MADEIEIPCLSFDLANLAGIAGAKQLQANFRDLRDFSKKLNLYLEAAAEAITGDDVWTERAANTDIISHIQTWLEADGVTAVPEATGGTGGQFITDLWVDPADHAIVASRAHVAGAAVVFDNADAWITVNLVAGVWEIGHNTVQAMTDAIAAPGEGFLVSVDVDARAHVAGASAGVIEGDFWIKQTWVGASKKYTLEHEAHNVGTHYAGTGGTAMVLRKIGLDAADHVNCDDVTEGALIGDTWINVADGVPDITLTHKAHGPNTHFIGGVTGEAIYKIPLDAADHVDCDSVETIAVGGGGTTYTSGDEWIAVDAGTHEITHDIPSTPVTSALGGTSGKMLGTLNIDAKNHSISVVEKWVPTVDIVSDAYGQPVLDVTETDNAGEHTYSVEHITNTNFALPIGVGGGVTFFIVDGLGATKTLSFDWAGHLYHTTLSTV